MVPILPIISGDVLLRGGCWTLGHPSSCLGAGGHRTAVGRCVCPLWPPSYYGEPAGGVPAVCMVFGPKWHPSVDGAWVARTGSRQRTWRTGATAPQLPHHNCGECKFFIGAIQFKPWEKIWKSWASGKCKFFMWLVAHDKCWMADRLARKGLPHPEHCLLCDQEAICYCIAFSHGRSGSVFYKGSVCRL